jgi:hypothetical protein
MILKGLDNWLHRALFQTEVMDSFVGYMACNPYTDHLAPLIANDAGNPFKSVRFLTHIYIEPGAIGEDPHDIDESI